MFTKAPRLLTVTMLPLLPMSVAAAIFALSLTETTIAAPAHERVIPITASRFQYSKKEIVVKKGVPVILELTSADVTHGFNLPDFHLRADIVPGKVTRVRLMPDKVGVFLFHCDDFCGAGHEEMDAVIKVVA